MKTTLENIANTVKADKSLSIFERRAALIAAIKAADPSAKIIVCNVEKPCTGRALGVKELSDRYRINYRCGYGRNNYAPCIEVMK